MGNLTKRSVLFQLTVYSLYVPEGYFECSKLICYIIFLLVNTLKLNYEMLSLF